MKILSHNKDEEGEAATVAFMDIKSANKAHSIEHKIEDRLLKTDYYDPSSFMDSSNCDQRNSSPRVTPEDCGPGPGGGLGGGGPPAFAGTCDPRRNPRRSRDGRGPPTHRGFPRGLTPFVIRTCGHRGAAALVGGGDRLRARRIVWDERRARAGR